MSWGVLSSILCIKALKVPQWYRRPDTARPVHNALTFLGSFSANWSAHYGVLSILSIWAQKYTRASDISTLSATAPCRLLRVGNPDRARENVIPGKINDCLISNVNYCSQLPTLLHDWRRSKLRDSVTCRNNTLNFRFSHWPIYRMWRIFTSVSFGTDSLMFLRMYSKWWNGLYPCCEILRHRFGFDTSKCELWLDIYELFFKSNFTVFSKGHCLWTREQ